MNAVDLAGITFNTRVFARVDGRTVAGTVTSTAHRGPDLQSVVVYSPELGHTNRIDHGVIVPAADILAVSPESPGYLVNSSNGYIHSRYMAGAR